MTSNPPRGKAPVESWLEAQGLTKSFRDGERITPVLNQIDLTVAQGETVAIVGPSGSGKSTLLHILGALDRPDSGSVQIGGQRISTLSATELAAFRNRTIGFVFQFHQLLPDFDALENVSMPGRIAGRPPQEVAARARDLLHQVGLGDRLDHFPNQLSGGERQRVALCRAVALEPALLLADEPTGNLDDASGERVLELLFDLREKLGITAILVTHDPAVAARCGRILELKEGRILPADTL